MLPRFGASRRSGDPPAWRRARPGPRRLRGGGDVRALHVGTDRRRAGSIAGSAVCVEPEARGSGPASAQRRPHLAAEWPRPSPGPALQQQVDGARQMLVVELGHGQQLDELGPAVTNSPTFAGHGTGTLSSPGPKGRRTSAAGGARRPIRRLQPGARRRRAPSSGARYRGRPPQTRQPGAPGAHNTRPPQRAIA